MEYIIVRAIQSKNGLQKGLEEGTESLEDSVNDMIEEGFEPIGGVVVVHTYYVGKEVIELLQAMVKR